MIKAKHVEVCDECGDELEFSDRICEVCGRDVCPQCSDKLEVHIRHPKWNQTAVAGRLCFDCCGEIVDRMIDIVPALRY